MAEAVIEPALAVIVAVPMPAPVANPVPPMVATKIEDELQLAALVRSWRLPSLYVPVAVNCWLVPFAIEPLTGLTETETRIGAVTATVAELVTVLELAVMLVDPSMFAVTNPAAVTGATAGNEDVHVTEAVTSCVLPSLQVPIALNTWLVPSGMEAPAGVIAIETSAGLPTVMEVELEMEFEDAERVAVPCPELVARP